MNSDPVETDIFKIMHNRRSVRKFTDQPVSDEVVEQILEAGIRAPFASQLYSIVYTCDKEKIKKYGTGAYPSTSLLMLFCVDFRKIEKIIAYKDYTYDYDDGMMLWLGLQDVSLVVENIILAAEAFGLGSVLLGATPLNHEHLADLFDLPKERVFPVVGLCLGYPEPESFAKTDIRPRYPLRYTAFEDSYHDLTEDELEECMEVMDKGYLRQNYYKNNNAKIPLKNREDRYTFDNYSWSEHIVRKVIQGKWGDESLLDKLRSFGFNLE